MLRNPYIVGVERFEIPFSPCLQAVASLQMKEHAALFCVSLWQHFQSDLRAIRYTISFEDRAEVTHEFSHQPHYSDLINCNTSGADQIDIEAISQRPTPTPRDSLPYTRQQDTFFPAFLEVFLPLCPPHPQHDELLPSTQAERHLVIWCRPSLLPDIMTLWEHAATLLPNQTS